MAEENIGEIIAVNLIPDPRLTNVMPGGVNVTQHVLSGGMGVTLEKGSEESSAYVTPWANYEYAAGDKVCVLIVSSNSLNPPSKGVSLDSSSEQVIWYRGASTNYAEVMIVRCADPTKCRLFAPGSGVLTVIKSGVFDLDSWNAMQERNIIYFDGGGLVQASESGYTLPPATNTTLGGVIVGSGLTITAQGVLSVLQQDLPIATQDTTGVVKIGNGLRASADGTLSVRLGENLTFDQSGNINASGGGSSSVDLSDYYTRAETDGKFLTKELAEATYATKDDLDKVSGGDADLTKYYTKTESDERYFLQSTANTRFPYYIRTITVDQSSDGNAEVQVAFTKPSGASGNPWIFITDHYVQSDTLGKTGMWKLWAIGSNTFTLRYNRFADGGAWATGAQSCKAHVLMVWGG